MKLRPFLKLSELLSPKYLALIRRFPVIGQGGGSVVFGGAVRHRKIRQAKRSFRRHDGGNIAIMTAISLMVLVGATAMSVDLSKGVNKKSRLADASDALSILLAKSRIQNDAEMRRVGMSFLLENYPAHLDDQIKIVSIKWDGDAVTVVLSDVSNNAFGGIFGDKKTEVSVASTAVFSRKIMDVALVLDSTGSMRGSKMSTLKTATSDMVDIIDDYADRNVRMSVVPFAQHVNVGVSARNSSWSQVLPDQSYRPAVRARPATSSQPARPGSAAIPARRFEGCMGSRGAPNHVRAAYNGRPIPAAYREDNINCGTALLPLTTSFSTVKSRVNSLVAQGATYMPAGLMWGWRTLDDSEPFAHSSDPDVEKVLILMTDGENTVIKNGALHNQGSRGGADIETRQICNAIKDKKIIIYTIAYEVNSNSTRNLLQGCASERSNYFDARNSEQLRKAFEDIANSLIEIRISA